MAQSNIKVLGLDLADKLDADTIVELLSQVKAAGVGAPQPGTVNVGKALFKRHIRPTHIRPTLKAAGYTFNVDEIDKNTGYFLKANFTNGNTVINVQYSVPMYASKTGFTRKAHVLSIES